MDSKGGGCRDTPGPIKTSSVYKDGDFSWHLQNGLRCLEACKGPLCYGDFQLSTTNLGFAEGSRCTELSEAKPYKKWGFPKIRGYLLGGPIIRTIAFWGLYWGPLILGNYQFCVSATCACVCRKKIEPSGMLTFYACK